MFVHKVFLVLLVKEISIKDKLTIVEIIKRIDI